MKERKKVKRMNKTVLYNSYVKDIMEAYGGIA